MRSLVAFAVVLVGCVASLPRDDAAITADLAAETAREVIRLRHEVAPTPVPPAPGGKCENCDGRGYVGDGTVRVPCQPCGGDGVL
jgi:hypothetical protein